MHFDYEEEVKKLPIFNDIISTVVSYASDGKAFDKILSSPYKDAYNVLSEAHKRYAIQTYHDAIKYFQREAQEELEGMKRIGNIDLLV